MTFDRSHYFRLLSDAEKVQVRLQYYQQPGKELRTSGQGVNLTIVDKIARGILDKRRWACGDMPHTRYE